MNKFHHRDYESVHKLEIWDELILNVVSSSYTVFMIKVEYLVKPRTSFNGDGNYLFPPSAALWDSFLSFISNIKFYPVQQFFLRNFWAELLSLSIIHLKC